MSFDDTIIYGKVRTKKFGAVLKKIKREKNFNCKNKSRALFGAWKSVVGEEISKATRIVSYEHGKLMVCVDSPALLHELKGFMCNAILEELKKTDGAEDVMEITFLAGR